MDPITASALVGGGSSIVGDIVNIFGRKKREQEARDYNEQQWDKQNAYNHPSAQMERLRQAGLNPNLIYGKGAGAANTAGDIPKGNPSEFNVKSPIEDIAKFANVTMTGLQHDNLRAENNIKIQEAALKAAQIGETASKEAKNRFDVMKGQSLLQYSVDAAKENLRQMENQSAISDIDLKIKDQGQRHVIKDIKYRAMLAVQNLENAKSEGQNKKYLGQLRQLEIELNKNGIHKGDPLWLRIFTQKGQDFLNNIKFNTGRSRPFTPN